MIPAAHSAISVSSDGKSESNNGSLCFVSNEAIVAESVQFDKRLKANYDLDLHFGHRKRTVCVFGWVV